MTHTLAMEWAQYNIRVNSVSPGLVNTAMTYWVPQQVTWHFFGVVCRNADKVRAGLGTAVEVLWRYAEVS